MCLDFALERSMSLSLFTWRFSSYINSLIPPWHYQVRPVQFTQVVKFSNNMALFTGVLQKVDDASFIASYSGALVGL